MIGLMQLIGAACTEYINLQNLFMSDEKHEIIMNLIAFGIIAEIDDFYFGSMKNYSLKQKAMDKEYIIPSRLIRPRNRLEKFIFDISTMLHVIY